MSKEYFETVASDWDEMQKSFFSDDIRANAFKMADIKSGETAIDVGAGTGYITSGLIAQGVNTIAIDQSSEMLKILKRKIIPPPGLILECKRGDAENLPLTDNYADYAFANMYLHHVEDPLLAIRQMTRVVKSGGKVVISDLDRHEYDFLEAEHHDRWKGFARSDLVTWFNQSGLFDVQVVDTGESCSSTSDEGVSAEVSVFIAIGTKK